MKNVTRIARHETQREQLRAAWQLYAETLLDHPPDATITMPIRLFFELLNLTKKERR